METVGQVIQALKARRPDPPNRESALFERAVIQLLAEGKSVSAQELAEKTGDPVEWVADAFAQMQRGGCQFNEAGELIGSALTLTPTRHQLRIKDQLLYAWCALDTLFIPAFVGQAVQIESTCPVTGISIHLMVTPDGIDTLYPESIVLSIVTSKQCTSGLNGSFCGRIHFFRDSPSAQTWAEEHDDVVILSAADAYRVAHSVYIEPNLKYG